jgi:hypothetical protein
MSTSYTVKLRFDVFAKAATLAGHRSASSAAKAMGLNRSTIARVMAGELQPGTTFIAGALVALTPMQFDDLFEVVPKPAETPG